MTSLTGPDCDEFIVDYEEYLDAHTRDTSAVQQYGPRTRTISPRWRMRDIRTGATYLSRCVMNDGHFAFKSGCQWWCQLQQGSP